MRNKKVLIISALVLIIIAMLLPLAAGMVFKKNYIKFLNSVNKDARIKVEILDYKQGWFYSYAKLRIYLVNNPLITLPSFTMEERISHGPIVHDRYSHRFRFGYANVESDIYLSNQPETINYTLPTHPSVIELNTIAEFDGDWFVSGHIPSLYISTPLIGKLYIEKLNGELKIIIEDKRINHVKMHMDTGNVSILIDDKNSLIKKIDFEPIEYTYDAVIENFGLWTGNSIFSTPILVMTKADGSTVILNKFSMTNTFSVGGDTFYNINLAISIDAAKIPISKLIPTISNLEILFSADNFDTKGVNDYIHLLKTDTSEEIMQTNRQKAESLLAHIVTKVSVFSLHTSTDTPIGKISLHSRTIWNQLAPLPNAMADLIKNSNTEIELRASSSFVNKIIEEYGPALTIAEGDATSSDPQVKPDKKTTPPILDPKATKTLIDNLTLLGYLHQDKNDYVTSITFANGICKINRVLVCPEQFKLPLTGSKPSQPTPLNKLPPPAMRISKVDFQHTTAFVAGIAAYLKNLILFGKIN